MSQFEDFEAMVGNANIGVHCVDKNGYVIYANAQELETLGYDRDEYIGHHVSEFEVVPGSLNELLEVLNSASAVENYPYQVKGKDGVKNIVFNSSIFRKEGEFIHTRCFGSEVELSVFKVFQQLKEK